MLSIADKIMIMHRLSAFILIQPFLLLKLLLLIIGLFVWHLVLLSLSGADPGILYWGGCILAREARRKF